jgi:RNA-binding protein 39
MLSLVQESYVNRGRDQYGNEMDEEQGMMSDDRILNRERRMDDYGDQFFGRSRDRDRDRDRPDRDRNGDRERNRRRRSEERSR